MSGETTSLKWCWLLAGLLGWIGCNGLEETDERRGLAGEDEPAVLVQLWCQQPRLKTWSSWDFTGELSFWVSEPRYDVCSDRSLQNGAYPVALAAPAQLAAIDQLALLPDRTYPISLQQASGTREVDVTFMYTGAHLDVNTDVIAFTQGQFGSSTGPTFVSLAVTLRPGNGDFIAYTNYGYNATLTLKDLPGRPGQSIELHAWCDMSTGKGGTVEVRRDCPARRQ